MTQDNHNAKAVLSLANIAFTALKSTDASGIKGSIAIATALAVDHVAAGSALGKRMLRKSYADKVKEAGFAKSTADQWWQIGDDLFVTHGAMIREAVNECALQSNTPPVASVYYEAVRTALDRLTGLTSSYRALREATIGINTPDKKSDAEKTQARWEGICKAIQKTEDAALMRRVSNLCAVRLRLLSGDVPDGMTPDDLQAEAKLLVNTIYATLSPVKRAADEAAADDAATDDAAAAA